MIEAAVLSLVYGANEIVLSLPGDPKSLKPRLLKRRALCDPGGIFWYSGPIERAGGYAGRRWLWHFVSICGNDISDEPLKQVLSC